MGSRARTVLTTVAGFVLLVAAWELAKLVLPAAGVTVGGVRLLPRTDDAAMPHVWTVLAKFGAPEVAGAADPRSIGVAVVSGALFTLGLALGGLVLGGIAGVLLALLMQRFALAERAVLSATGDPSQMYAAILGAAVLGLVAAGAVGLLDLGLRRYRGSVS